MKKNRTTILTIVVIILGIYTCVIGINANNPHNNIAGTKLELYGAELSGGEVSDDVLKGSDITLAYIWSATCEDCINGLDSIMNVQDEYGDRVKIVGYITDAIEDNAIKVIDKKDIDFQNILINDESKDFIFENFYDIPLVLFVDDDGIVQEPYLEIMVNYNELKRTIDELLMK